MELYTGLCARKSDEINTHSWNHLRLVHNFLGLFVNGVNIRRNLYIDQLRPGWLSSLTEQCGACSSSLGHGHKTFHGNSTLVPSHSQRIDDLNSPHGKKLHFVFTLLAKPDGCSRVPDCSRVTRSGRLKYSELPACDRSKFWELVVGGRRRKMSTSVLELLLT